MRSLALGAYSMGGSAFTIHCSTCTINIYSSWTGLPYQVLFFLPIENDSIELHNKKPADREFMDYDDPDVPKLTNKVLVFNPLTYLRG
jgi:hypothetical protein